MVNAFESRMPSPAPLEVTDVFAEIDPHAVVPTGPSEPDYAMIARSPEFRRLRRALLRFAVPMTVLFLGWYLTYVIAAAYFPGFMSIRLWGSMNVGLLWGIGQFVTTLAITLAYQCYAEHHIDPKVAEVRAGVRGGER